MEAPKLFISYSWSNIEHEQWVLELATNIRESGVNVILDKWDLREGNDAYAFMEKMVTDPDIAKVAIISDRKYSEKADGRSNGVGTETQIISKEVYENQQQNKFVAIVSEKDENGKPYLPTYYKSRIYIDLSEPDSYSDNFEKLLRWIFDKPLYIKPEIGKRPEFLENDTPIRMGTSVLLKRAIDAIKNDKTIALGLLDEYLELFSQNLELFRIKSKEGEFDENVVKSIQDFLPYRDEAIQLFITISKYVKDEEYIRRLHRFFERLIPYLYRSDNTNQWTDVDFDNFKFIIHELFLYAIAICLKHERYNFVVYLVEQKYYLLGNSDHGREVMVSFITFRQYIKSLENRTIRLNLRRLSLRADLLKERNKLSGIEFRYLMQADFVLFIRADLDSEGSRWWPETLIYLGHFNSAFEIFARANSRKYFNKIKIILGIDSPEGLDNLLNKYREEKRTIPRWESESFNPSSLLGYEQLGKRE